MAIQRGRKSAASLAVIPIGDKPRVVTGSRPPKHLRREEVALWPEIVAELGVETTTQFAVLTAALEAHATMRECRLQIAREGLLVAGTDNQMKANPLLGVERGARQGMLVALRQLGFGKISRAKKEIVYNRYGNPTKPGHGVWDLGEDDAAS